MVVSLTREETMPRDRVQIPAIGMIVAAGLDVAFAMVMLVVNLVGISMFHMPEAIGGRWGSEVTEDILLGGFGVMLCVVGIIIDAVIIIGANKMRKLDSYGFAVAAAILSVIPCLSSPCFILGLPFGIWALVVLMDQRVRDAFWGGRKAGEPTSSGPGE
jgi:hypothetical protein